MIDDFSFEKQHRRGLVELNLVPVIDMLTGVIFFLLLSTIFVGLTKLTLPPSVSSLVPPSEINQDPPINPKILVRMPSRTQIVIVAKWSGRMPGENQQTVSLGDDSRTNSKMLLMTAQELAEKLKSQFPSERTLQLGLTGGAPFQYLISMMDGCLPSFPDVVLIQETQEISEGRHAL